jgi:SAM-dependent methyltransferase
MDKIACELCGSADYKPYFQPADRFSGEVFHIVKCSRCGFIYLNPRPNSTELVGYYPEHYEPHAGFDIHASPLAQFDHDRGMNIQLDFVEKFIPQRGKLLDIGCGTGDFLAGAKSRGWDTQGIELSESAGTIAKQRYGLDVTVGSLNSLSFLDNHYNVITLWDVLEHLPHPLNAFLKINQALLPQGFVIFTIPNLDSFDRYLFGRKWIGWEAPRHFSFFNSDTLKVLVNKTSFVQIDKKCILGGKGTFFLSLDTWLGQKRFAGLIQKFYPLLGLALWPYRRISYALNRGPILTVVAQKEGTQ